MRVYTKTPATEFHSAFPGIQLRLHSERIPPHQTRVLRREVRTASEGARLFTAFKATSRRLFVGFAHPFARPIRIGEMIRRFHEIGGHERRRFGPEHYLEKGIPDMVELPAYALGRDEYLLLDGNHRATALCLTRRPFRLRLRVLEAPVDRRYLIDLKYWDGGLRRFPERLRQTLG